MGLRFVIFLTVSFNNNYIIYLEDIAMMRREKEMIRSVGR
jgi:hypothetical protein